MTGYGRGEVSTDEWDIAAEFSGVNRKQLDLAINLPGKLGALEPDVRKQITALASRGRINGRITVTPAGSKGGGKAEVVVDEALVLSYRTQLEGLASSLGPFVKSGQIEMADLLRLPGVFKLQESAPEPDALAGSIREAVDAGMAALIAMQEVEGAHLREDLEARITAIAEEKAAIEVVAPTVKEHYRANLIQRLRDADIAESQTIDLDDDRILREIGLFAERCDISEETTRIDSHVSQFRSYFEQSSSGESVGRQLDFLCQELHRELNTIGSKANDARIAQHIVNAKTELEKIREQVQNVQ